MPSICPGHGESSAPSIDYTAGYFTDTVGALLDVCEVQDALVVGESIGGSIALALAARQNTRISQVVAINPYDYGRWGGIRRSSALANVLFTAMLWPAIGPVIARTETKGILRRVLTGGLHDPAALPADLVERLSRCGALPGHARAFRSLCLHWRSWIDARAAYGAIDLPVTLVLRRRRLVPTRRARRERACNRRGSDRDAREQRPLLQPRETEGDRSADQRARVTNCPPVDTRRVVRRPSSIGRSVLPIANVPASRQRLEPRWKRRGAIK